MENHTNWQSRSIQNTVDRAMTGIIGDFPSDRLGELETVLLRFGYNVPIAKEEHWNSGELQVVRDFAQQCAHVISVARHRFSIQPQIFYAVILSAEVNAAAVRMNDEFVVVITAGVLARVSSLFRRLVTVDAVYGLLADRIIASDPVFGDPVTEYMNSNQLSEDRFAIADLLFQVAVRYLVLSNKLRSALSNPDIFTVY